MKNICDYLCESFEEDYDEDYDDLYEDEEVSSEEEFKEYAENKFKEVFGDDLDEDEMKEVIDGIIKKCDGDWGKAVGMLNKSFAE